MVGWQLEGCLDELLIVPRSAGSQAIRRWWRVHSVANTHWAL